MYINSNTKAKHK